MGGGAPRALSFGVSDGDRTRGHRNHNPALYQLSYTHHKFKPPSPQSSPSGRGLSSTDQRITLRSTHQILARLRGLEPLTRGLEGRCSVQLSYRRKKRSAGLLSCCLFAWAPGRSTWSGRADLNCRPPAPKAGALTRLRYAPRKPTIIGPIRAIGQGTHKREPWFCPDGHRGAFPRG